MASVQYPFGLQPNNSIKPSTSKLTDEYFFTNTSDNGILKKSLRFTWDPETAKFWLQIYSGNNHPLKEQKENQLHTTIIPTKNAGQLRYIRKLVQINTIQATLTGKYYLPDNKTCYISKNKIKNSISNRKVYRHGFKFSIEKSRNKLQEYSFINEKDKTFFDQFSVLVGDITRVFVISGDCLESSIIIQKGFPVCLLDHSIEKSHDDEIIQIGKSNCMLIAASPFLIGGGWKNGSSGQEENICRRSTLIHCLEDIYSLNTPAIAVNKQKKNEIESNSNEDHKGKRKNSKKQKSKKVQKYKEKETEELQSTNMDWTMDEFGGIYNPNVLCFRGPEYEGYPFLQKCYSVPFVSVSGSFFYISF